MSPEVHFPVAGQSEEYWLVGQVGKGGFQPAHLSPAKQPIYKIGALAPEVSPILQTSALLVFKAFANCNAAIPAS
jgi:hypothetical protein